MSDKTSAPRIRLTRAAVHDEFVQIDVTTDPSSTTTKKKKSSRCKHCSQVLSGVNPTNLKDHLKAFHVSVYQKVKGNFLIIPLIVFLFNISRSRGRIEGI